MPQESLRLKTWFHWTPEEKSHAIYEGYFRRILKSHEIKNFLWANRLNNLSNWGYPLIAYPLFCLTLFRLAPFRSIYYKHRSQQWIVFKYSTVVASWVLWLNFNPAFKNLEQKKEDLLDLVYEKMGDQLTQLNDALPRWNTTQEYHRRTQKLYNQRNGWLVGILYPQEQYSYPLVDMSSFPTNFIPDKITK
ncbi:hypothetical protein IMG5_122500 [Ichthyophthirius multifiliis]|uniref:Transmembrane protein n=1 Tax=Ichthyophthirius multifiliis TaxID=5932 RepID=G0QVA5_ICHMU|nr:hypothetical protein IMG5_122500 [Ichthyophthirius multifiliis]EGR30849.1 hypothetical protein IMG5_122500 [Ichthyophthirius multifiliis]|eukprot:XP_004032436.1 hypothetical protein IMG5_122500 [Ichthyophthirius multifiliis]